METNLIWLEGRGSNCRRGYLDRLQVGWMDVGLYQWSMNITWMIMMRVGLCWLPQLADEDASGSQLKWN